MRRGACLLLLIAALLIVSLAIPSYTYSPPVAGFVDSTVRVYKEPVKWVGYLECTADTTSYYYYLVNWTLSYSHDYGVSDLGIFKTTILVDNWSRFLREGPTGCDILGRNEVTYNDEFQRTSERLKNLTVGTPDYEKLKPFFLFLGSPEKPVNLTRVHITVFSTGSRKPVKLPFLFVWLGVLILGVVGVFVSYRHSKALLALFLITVVLSALFIVQYVQMERKISGASKAFNELLSLNSTNRPCTEIGGAQGDFRSSGDVEWFLKTVEENNATIASVRWEDYSLRIRIGINEGNYRELLTAFKKRGWETSELDVENFTPEDNWIIEANETLKTLEKYLPYLTTSERKVVEEYMAGLNETINRMTGQNSWCLAVFATNPEVILPDYGDYSNFLARLGLIVAFIGLLMCRRTENEEG